MKTKKICLITFIIFMGLISTGSIFTPLGKATADQDESSVNITILDAFYADLDEGGVENDIYVEFTLNLTLPEDNGFFILYFTLVLPSGTEYHYHTTFSIASSTNYCGELFYYNYATEAGWYEVKSLGILFQQEGIDWYYTSYIFDPPGGSGGDDPQCMMLFLLEDFPSVIV